METIINTPCGPVKGGKCRLEGVTAYKGIRYATAGRWEYPKAITEWEGVYDATSYGNCSYQARAFYNEEENQKKYFYYNEFRKGETYTYSEDCLFLNIWTPEGAKEGDRLPVLFYIHGGGYTGGCGHEKHFDDPVWPKHGVIAVTINYRLGPMGFLCLPELKQEAGHTGNYGLYDQVEALHWVKRNIASFGGDPDAITIMGQSAGAMSVQHLCQTPLTDGLFRAAVLSSGCGAGAMMCGTEEKTGAFWKTVMERCGCETLEQFRNVSPDVLFAAWDKAKKEVKGGATASSPVKDGLMVGSDSQPKEIPYMAGTTSHDMMPPILFQMGKKWVASRKMPSWYWYFDRMLPGDDKGAWHSSDLWYWFGTLDNCWRPMEGRDEALSNRMVRYLMNFVKTGNPNAGNLPKWVPVQEKKQALFLGESETRMGNPSMAKMTWTMLTNEAPGE